MTKTSKTQTHNELVERKNALEQELIQIERQIYDLETSYLEETSHTGNVLKGWDGYLAGSHQKLVSGKKKGPRDQDRLFSNSSTTHKKALALTGGVPSFGSSSSSSSSSTTADKTHKRKKQRTE